MKIFKYPIFRFKQQYVELPWGYKILHFGNQDNDMFIWVAVNSNHATSSIEFNIVGTGHEIPNGEHIGTVILPDGYVWHLFERK